VPSRPSGHPRRLPVPRFSGSLETEEQAESFRYPRIAESKSSVLRINAIFTLALAPWLARRSFQSSTTGASD
jgi:hypothetical protein